MGGFLVNNVFTAIQNRDGEALSRMSGYEHQYTNNDNVVNMSAERLVDALFKQLKQLFPAAVVTNLKTPEQEVAAKQQWIAAFAEGGIRTREQVSAGMRHARASESPFWPSPGQFIKWCKDSKMVLGVTIDDVMAEFHRYSKEKSLYPGGPERFPWRHPVMYWVVCDTATATPTKAKKMAALIENWTPPDGWCNGNDRDWHEKMKGYICDFLRKCNGFRVM
ncbi:replication protein P [Escherichia coli]